MQLPLFIYGTLLKGECNHHLLAGRLHQELPATCQGTLLLIEGDGYPYPALTAGDQVIHGRLIYPRREVYGQLLREIDALEDYNPERDAGLYLRRTLEVKCGEMRLPAQSYLWNGPVTAGHVIPDGDFSRWNSSQKALQHCENL